MDVKNANKIKQMSLKDCLNSLSDDQLNQMYDEMVNLFDGNLSMDSSKKDLIESYLMSLYSMFIFNKEKQFEEMRKLLLNIINGEEEINDGLLDRSFLFKINNYCILIVKFKCCISIICLNWIYFISIIHKIYMFRVKFLFASSCIFFYNT